MRAAAQMLERSSHLRAFVAGPRTASRSQRSEIERHAAEAAERWPLLGATIIHRYGRILPGEDIVLVATASSHRDAAFAAADFLMDYLKTRAPFWKQVEKANGTTWVDAKATDDAAAERWAVQRRQTETAE